MVMGRVVRRLRRLCIAHSKGILESEVIMPVTKSGISTPANAPSKPLGAPVKVYPGSSKIGARGNAVQGPVSKK